MLRPVVNKLARNAPSFLRGVQTRRQNQNLRIHFGLWLGVIQCPLIYSPYVVKSDNSKLLWSGLRSVQLLVLLVLAELSQYVLTGTPVGQFIRVANKSMNVNELKRSFEDGVVLWGSFCLRPRTRVARMLPAVWIKWAGERYAIWNFVTDKKLAIQRFRSKKFV